MVEIIYGNNNSAPMAVNYYQEIVPVITGGPVSNFQAPLLPSGMTINNANGTISGTPISIFEPQDEYKIIYDYMSASYDLFVFLPVVFNPISKDIFQLFPNSFELSYSPTKNIWGYDPFSNFSSNNLPNSLAIDVCTGNISGTITDPSGLYSVNISYDISGSPEDFILNMGVVDITQVTYPDTVLKAYVPTTISLQNLTLDITVGTSYEIVFDTLPPGLRLNPNAKYNIVGSPEIVSFQQPYVYYTVFEFFGIEPTAFITTHQLNLTVLPSKFFINTDFLLPYDKTAPGETINLQRYTNNAAIEALIAQGYLDNMVLFIRRCYNNLQLTQNHRKVALTLINYDCPMLRFPGIIGLQPRNNWQVMSEIFNRSSEYGRLVNLIFKYGEQIMLKGMYLQDKKMILDINLNQ